MYGNLELCKFIMDNVDDSNPKTEFGSTPFAVAAAYGHLEVCKMIIERIEDKNPADYFGRTPFHFAAGNGNLNIAILIIMKAKVHITIQVHNIVQYSLFKHGSQVIFWPLL